MFFPGGLEDSILLKCVCYNKEIYRFNATFMKIPMTFIAELERISKIQMELQKTQKTQGDPGEEKSSVTSKTV